MKKFEALVCTGKLEVYLQEHEQAMSMVKNLQKCIENDDCINAVINCGKMCAFCMKAKIADEVIVDSLYSLMEYVANISKENNKTSASPDMPIEEMDLSGRSYNCLKYNGITTLGDILATSASELVRIRNFGATSYDEVTAKVRALGYPDFGVTDYRKVRWLVYLDFPTAYSEVTE